MEIIVALHARHDRMDIEFENSLLSWFHEGC